MLTGLVGILGARLGLITPFFGFNLLLSLMPVGLLLSLFLGLIGLFRTRPRQRRGGASQAWAGLLLSTALVGWIALLFVGARVTAPIHDVTTNIDDPPVFAAAASEDSRDGGFAYPSGGAEVPDLQRQFYPDLDTLRLDISRAEALRRVRHTAEALNWEVIQDEADDGPLEFADTTSGFRFIDFIAVRVRTDGDGAAVDVRSVSQFGLVDFGKNASRIRDFLDRLGPNA